MKNAINTDLEWMNYDVSIENVPIKQESYQKNDKFVTSKTKICLFY